MANVYAVPNITGRVLNPKQYNYVIPAMSNAW